VPDSANGSRELDEPGGGRSNLFGHAGYGYCPSHTRWYWGTKMLALVRPARKDEKKPRPFPNWLRQRVEAVIWTLKNQLGLERHGGRSPAGLWARIVQRLLALNATICSTVDRRARQALTDRV
jgi:hypothetical protein